MRRVAVFTGSAFGDDERWAEAARRLTTHLAGEGVGIVYGGGTVGLMGVVADTAMAAGAEVIGVIPQGLFASEVPHYGLTRLHEVGSMHERKALMAQEADAFVALPGGIGTLEELFEVWTWRSLGIHDKPVALYDVDGFWQPLLGMLDGMVDAGFVRPATRDTLQVHDDPADLLDGLRRAAR